MPPRKGVKTVNPHEAPQPYLRIVSSGRYFNSFPWLLRIMSLPFFAIPFALISGMRMIIMTMIMRTNLVIFPARSRGAKVGPGSTERQPGQSNTQWSEDELSVNKLLINEPLRVKRCSSVTNDQYERVN